jgi:hypothetical protein
MEPIEVWTDGYTLVKPSKVFRLSVKSALSFLRPLCKELGLPIPRIFYYRDEENGCATYCNGSSQEPVIGLCPESYQDIMRLDEAIGSSICHELFHAFLESCGMYCSDYDHPEGEVEQLARDYCDELLTEQDIREELTRIAQEAME